MGGEEQRVREREEGEESREDSARSIEPQIGLCPGLGPTTLETKVGMETKSQRLN